MTPWYTGDLMSPFSLTNDYFSLYGTLRVFAYRDSFTVDTMYAKAVFPRLPTHRDIRLKEMSRTYSHNLKSRDIDHRMVLSTLSDVFHALAASGGSIQAFQMRIYQILHEALSKDQFSGGPGLPRCRCKFVILAHFSKVMDSYELASALASFFLSCPRFIVSREKWTQLGAWGLALMDLNPRVVEADMEMCLRALAERIDDIHSSWFRYRDHRWPHLMQLLEDARLMIAPRQYNLGMYDHGSIRGRHPRRQLMYDVPRAITVPPLHSQQYLMPAPPIGPASYSPSPNMEMMLGGGFVEEGLNQYDRLRISKLENKLHDVENVVADIAEDISYGP